MEPPQLAAGSHGGVASLEAAPLVLPGAALMSSSYSAKWLSVAWPRMAAGSVTSATTMSAESPGLLMRATGSSASNGSVTAYQSCAVTVTQINKHAAKRMGRRNIANNAKREANKMAIH